MAKVWKWIAVIFIVLLAIGAALIGVAYACGGSVERLISTTDIFDLTKFVSRETLQTIVTAVLGG